MLSGSLFTKAAKALAGGATRAGRVGLDVATSHSSLKGLGQAFLKRPLGTAALAGTGLAFAAPIAAQLGGGLADAGRLLSGGQSKATKQLLAQEQMATRMDAFEQARRERNAIREEAIRRNLVVLQMQAPDLYAKVAAGIDLPEGAMVIGGSGPRQDLLRELAGAMSDEAFHDPEARSPLADLVS